MTRTLRGRLWLGTTIGTGCVLAGAATALFLIVKTALYAEFDETLGAKARSLAALTEQDGHDIELEINPKNLPEFNPSGAPEYYQFQTDDGTIVGRSPSLGDSVLSHKKGEVDTLVYSNGALPDGRTGRYVTLSFVPRNDGPWFGLTPAKPIGVTVVVARTTDYVERTLMRLRWLLVLGCAATMAVTILVLHWSVSRGLVPIRTLAGEIAAIGETSLSTRVPEDRAPAEMQPVIVRLNDLLGRLETAFAREKAITADVAHELRTPLAGLRSTLEVALARPRSAQESQLVMAKGLDICGQMQRMVETLLELARADAGQLEFVEDQVDVVTLIQTSWALFDHRAETRTLDTVWQMPDTCVVATDRMKLQLVLSNLLDNAVTYTNDGGRITISVAVSAKSLGIEIVNTGCTMTHETIGHIFQRFWRGDPSRKTDDGRRRCGLGLPLSHRLITIMGGTLSADLRHGSEFAATITLPVDPRACGL